MMKKIVVLVIFVTGFVSCTKQIKEEIVEKQISEPIEKEVEVDREVTSQTVLTYYYEQTEGITLNKAENEVYKNILAYNGALFITVEVTNGSQKTYAIQKYDLTTKTTTKVLENLAEIQSIAFSNKYMFVAQNNYVEVFNNQTFTKELTVGFGDSAPFRMEVVKALYVTEKYLIVRDTGQLRFYSLNDIIPANNKKVPLLVKSARYTADTAYISVFKDLLYFHRIQNGRKRFQYYALNSEGLIEAEATTVRETESAPVALFTSIVPNGNELFVSSSDGTIKRVNPVTFEAEVTYSGNDIADIITIFDNTIYGINKNQGKIIVFERKDIVYKKYVD